VALRDPQVDELPVVAADALLEILERAARFGIALRAKEDLRASEIELVIARDDDVLERRDRVGRRRGGVAQRKLVVDAQPRFGAPLAIAGKLRRPREPRKRVLRLRPLVVRQ